MSYDCVMNDDALLKVYKISAETWDSIASWGNETFILYPKEVRFLTMVACKVKRSQALSQMQARYAMNLYNKAIDSGWKNV